MPFSVFLSRRTLTSASPIFLIKMPPKMPATQSESTKERTRNTMRPSERLLPDVLPVRKRTSR